MTCQMDLNPESVAPGGKRFAGQRHSNLSETVKIDQGCGIRIDRCRLLPVSGLAENRPLDLVLGWNVIG
jgi:hypothetical protein